MRRLIPLLSAGILSAALVAACGADNGTTVTCKHKVTQGKTTKYELCETTRGKVHYIYIPRVLYDKTATGDSVDEHGRVVVPPPPIQEHPVIEHPIIEPHVGGIK